MKKNIPIYCFTIIIGAFLILAFLLNFHLIIKPIDALSDDEATLKSFTEDVQKQYTSNSFARNSFINLNGLFIRAIGKKTNNNVDKLQNGMLINSNINLVDTSNLSSGINKLNSHLENNDIKFLYVQLPMKVDKENTLITPGYTNFANQSANELLAKLDKEVSYIDMRDYIAKNPEQIEKYFYSTDHHWNTYGAFEAYGIILNYLKEEFPKENIDLSNADISNWSITVYKDWFLGSLGKRVGKYYGGVDDLTIMTPKFKTAMSMYITNHRQFTSGSFYDAVIVDKYLDKPDYFNENPYCAYIGGDYPLVNHKNNNAINDLKVLIIKDSFTLPLQAFLSTSVKELDVLDARHFNECTIAEYIEISKPDIVIMTINPSMFIEKKYQSFGIDEATFHINQTEKTEVTSLDSFEIATKKDGNNYIYKVVMSNLEYNTKYSVSLDEITPLTDGVDGVTVALYNKSTKKILSSYVFDLNFCKNNGYEWTFLTPDITSGDLQLLIYCGLHSKTAGKTVEYSNLVLYKYE